MNVRRSPPPPKQEREVDSGNEFVNTKRGYGRQVTPPNDQDASLIDGIDVLPGAGTQSQDMSALIAGQTSLISKLVSDVAQIKTQNCQIQKSNESIEAFMSFMNLQFESLKDEVESLKKERKEQSLYIQDLEKKIIDLQQKSRSSGVEIRNIPLLENESPASLMEVVKSIGQITGTGVTNADFRDVYRLPGTLKTPRPVVAEFHSVQTKQKILNSIRNYNKNKKTDAERVNTVKLQLQGPLKVVNVSEQLSPSTKRLLYLAQEFKRKHTYAYCWVANGNIFLRKEEGGKQIIIRSEQCLKNLSDGLVKPTDK